MKRLHRIASLVSDPCTAHKLHATLIGPDSLRIQQRLCPPRALRAHAVIGANCSSTTGETIKSTELKCSGGQCDGNEGHDTLMGDISA